MSNYSYKSFDQYYINTQEILGNGQYGKVYKGYYNVKDEFSEKRDIILAIKETQLPVGYFKEEQQSKTKAAIREIESLSKLKHPNIIKFIDAKKTQNNIYLVMEYCNEGDLAHLLQKKYSQKIMSEMEVLTYFRQIIDAFRFIIEKNYVHRDIKPENILVHNDQLKVADFGFCKFSGVNDILETITGTPLFQDPAISEASSYTSKSDIFSLGILLWHMLYYDPKNQQASYPWYAQTSVLLVNNMKTIPIHFPDRRKVSEQTKELIRKMVQIDQNKRISWAELFDHEKLKPMSHKIDNSLQKDEMTTTDIDVKDYNEFKEKYQDEEFKTRTNQQQKASNIEKIKKEARVCQQRLDFEYYITALLFNTATDFLTHVLPKLPDFPQELQLQLNYILYKRQLLKSERLFSSLNELKNNFNVPNNSWLAYCSDIKNLEKNKKKYEENNKVCQKNFDTFFKITNDHFQGKNEFINNEKFLDGQYADSILKETLIQFLPQLLEVQIKLEKNSILSEFDEHILNIVDNLLMIYTQDTTLQYDYKKQQNFQKFFDERKITPKKRIFIRILQAYKYLHLI